MNTQGKIHIPLFLILFFILSTPVLHAADQSVNQSGCDGGASVSTQTEDLIPLPCGAEPPALSPVGACENNVKQFEIHNGCTPLTLYEKTGDGAWVAGGEVQRTFSHWCEDANQCEDAAQIKV